jgi:hypothetical protein
MMKENAKDSGSDYHTMDSCDKGTFLVHKNFKDKLTAGIRALQPATGKGQEDFFEFHMQVDRDKEGLIFPILEVRKSPKDETFIFTLDLFKPGP